MIHLRFLYVVAREMDASYLLGLAFCFLLLSVEDTLRCLHGFPEGFSVPLLQPVQMARQVLLHGEQRLGGHLELPGVLPMGEPPVEPPAVAFPLLGQQVDQKAVIPFALG